MSRSMPPSTPFGLLAWLQNTRIQLPLRAVDCRFHITGDIAVVEIDQIFYQTARESLDVTYTFPLPEGAATYRCEMQVNGRIVRAQVMEQEEARRTAAEHRAQGHRTALVERERENLFTLEMGNLAPGDQILMRFAYFQTLERLGNQLSLRIPFCPGQRYVPGNPLLRDNKGRGVEDDTDQVPDASRISPPRMNAAHPDAASLHLMGTLHADDVKLPSFSSPSHLMLVRPENEELHVRLAPCDHVPDRDFVMRWEESSPAQAASRAWTCHKDGRTYALMQVRAPQETAAVADSWEQDIYFLLDRSGSMGGGKWIQCARALHAFVKELGTNDRVWITCFGSSFVDFSDSPMTPAKLLADEGFRSIAGLGVGGGTELLPALEHVLARRKTFSANRRCCVILITDGQVGNEAAILSRMNRESGVPMYCFGIDRAVNDSFLKTLSSDTGGRCALMTPDDDIQAAVRHLAQALRRPVLTGLSVSPGWSLANELHSLPNLHAGEVILVAAETKGMGGEPLRVTAQTVDGAPWRSTDISHSQDNPAPRLIWAQHRLRHLSAQGRKGEAVTLAITHNIIGEGTALIAWDESEKVPVAQRNAYQPSMDVWNYSIVGPIPACAAPTASGGAGWKRSKQHGAAAPRPIAAHLAPPASRSDRGKIGWSLFRAFQKTPHQALASEITARYRVIKAPSWAAEKGLSLAQWRKILRRKLSAENFANAKEVAGALAALLFHWASQATAATRARQVAEALQGAPGEASPLATLEQLVTTALDAGHRADAKRLLSARHAGT